MLTAGMASGHLVWTMEQLLERVQVSRSTIYRWIERDGFPVVRIGEGSRPLFLPESVLGWLRSRQRTKPTAAKSPATSSVPLDAMALTALLPLARRPRSRRTPPPPIATAGSRERLRRTHGAR